MSKEKEKHSHIATLNKGWKNCFHSSQNIDEAFVEIVLKGFLPMWVVFLLFYLVSGFILAEIPELLLIHIPLAVCGAIIIWFVLQKRLTFATYMFIVLCVFTSLFNLVHVGYWDPGVVVGLIFSVIIAIAILPNTKWAICLPAGLTIVFAAGAFWNVSTGKISPLPNASVFSNPITATFALGIMLGMTSILIYRIRTYKSEWRDTLHQSEDAHDRTIARLSTNLIFSVQVHQDGTLESEWLSGKPKSLLGIAHENRNSLEKRMLIVHPDDRDRMIEDTQKVIRKCITTKENYRIYNAEGQIEWISLKRLPIWDEDQKRVVRYYGVVEYITEQKEAEETLKASNNYMKTLLNALPDRVIVFDEDGTYLSIYNFYDNIKGFEYSNNPVGKSVYDVEDIPKHLAGLIVENVRKAIQTNEMQVVEYQTSAITKPDEVRWAEGRILSLNNVVNGKRTALWITRDINQRRQAEEALRKNNNYMKTLLNALPDRVIVFDEDGRYLFLYAGYNTPLLQSEPIVGKYIHDLNEIPKYLADLFVEKIRDALETNEMQVAEYVYNSPTSPDTNKIWWAEGRVLSLHNTVDGKRTVMWVNRDITDRKISEIEMQESEAKYRRLYENVPVGLFQSTPEGRLLTANAAMIDLLAYPDLETLLSKNTKDLYVNPSQREAWQSLIKHKESIDFPPIQLRRYDGTEIWVELNIHLVSGKRGSPTYYEGAARDITDRKNAELAIIALNSELEKRVIQRTSDLLEANRQLNAEVKRRQQSEISEIKQRILAEALLDTAIVMTSALEIDEVISQILSNIHSVIEFKVGLVFLENDTIMPVAQQGYSSDEFNIIKENTMKFKAQGDHLQYLLNNFSSDSKDADDIVNLPLSIDRRMKSTLSMPISYNNEIIGFILLGSDIVDYFAPHNIHIMDSFARQVGVAIENAKRHAVLRQVAILEERNRIARDLHDTISQNLWSLMIVTDALPQLWEKQRDLFREALEDIAKTAQTTLIEMRSLLMELQPQFLSDATLEMLINNIVKSVSSKLGIQIDFQCNVTKDIPKDIKIVFYRVAQEALNNITRHANAQIVQIQLIETSEYLELTVQDDGIGFDIVHVPAGHMGIRNMMDSAKIIHADLTITSKKDMGTKLKLRLEKDYDHVREGFYHKSSNCR